MEQSTLIVTLEIAGLLVLAFGGAWGFQMRWLGKRFDKMESAIEKVELRMTEHERMCDKRNARQDQQIGQLQGLIRKGVSNEQENKGSG